MTTKGNPISLRFMVSQIIRKVFLPLNLVTDGKMLICFSPLADRGGIPALVLRIHHQGAVSGPNFQMQTLPSPTCTGTCGMRNRSDGSMAPVVSFSHYIQKVNTINLRSFFLNYEYRE